MRQAAMISSLLASAVAAGLSLWLTFRPESKSTEIAPYIVAALLVAVLTGRRWLRLSPNWGWLALAVALLMLMPVTVIARAFGSIDMLALVFHLEFGTEGAGLGGLERDIAVGGIVSVAVFLAVIIFGAVAGWPQMAWVAALAIVVANPILRGMVAMAMPGMGGGTGESLLAFHVEPAIKSASGGQEPDVVVIYVEGADRIFADTARFGDAMERLMSLAGPGAIDLTGVGPMVGTGWSLSGMAASQCGVPVMPNGLRFGLNYEEQRAFMVDVTCLSDVLAARGYRTEFIVGGDALFGGASHFYDSHGVTDHIDIADIVAMVPPADFAAANLGWVVDDQILMDVALQRHAALAAEGAPMFLVIETSGPHGIEVWMSRRCTESGRAEVGFDNAAGVRCTGGLVADFVDTLRSAPDARPTLFVVLSDHINHNPDLKASDGFALRRNTVILIPPAAGPAAGPLRVIDREAAMIDVFPTILDILGLIEPGGAAGLGVSLLGETPTLVERFGREGADDRLERDAALAARLWQ
jgi:phosphoglycerol transferase